ncbi:MAG: hypothetical protein J5845_04015 [Lachnospiraceae bacterium]|nr:hypothetical protein [Lachnospiraceae bacterium]
MGLGSGRKEAREQTVVPITELLSERQYNLILCAIMFFGTEINYLFAATAGSLAEYAHPVLLFLMYVAVMIVGYRMSLREDEPLSVLAGYAMVVIPAGFAASLIVDLCSAEYCAEPVADVFLILLLVVAPLIILALVKAEWFANIFALIGAYAAGIGLGILFLEIFGFGHCGYSWIPAALLSFLMYYETYCAQRCAMTFENAVSSMADIYMDVMSIFKFAVETFLCYVSEPYSRIYK